MKAPTFLALATLLAGINLPAAETKPDRALIAMVTGQKQVYLGWRLLGTDSSEIAFNVYRATDGGVATKLNAEPLRAAGVRRVNVSLDTLDREQFARLTRRDRLPQVLEGIAAARAAGLAVKLNTVALKGVNEAEIPDLVAWAHGQGMELTLIEVMPLGEVEEDRIDHYLPLSTVRAGLEQRFSLTPDAHRSGGPARYVQVGETGGRLGFITPLTGNFCDGCNRVRVTATGQLYACLGGTEQVDLRAALRSPAPDAALAEALNLAMRIKPERHSFAITGPGGAPALARHMSVTGG